jgi:hypothetical protein
MDLNSIIVIVIAIVVIYLFFKFIVSPVFKAIMSALTFLVLIYILHRFFNFDLNQVLGPLGKYIDLNKLDINFNWILEQINNFWQNISKSINK